MRRSLAVVLLAAMLLPTSTAAQLHDYAAGQRVVVTVPSKPIRAQPTTKSAVVITVSEGRQLEIIDGDPIQGEGLTWWNVATTNSIATGWLPDSAFAAQETENDTGASDEERETNDLHRCWDQSDVVEQGGIPTWSMPPAMVIDPAELYVATISTTKGEIVIELDAANAPIATNNFVCLAEAGYYDDTDFHRIAEGMFIQGGDPTGAGMGMPGYVVPSDPITGQYPAGSIALANAEPDQNGAQFFITTTDLTGEIPDDYPVFGHVVSGIGVAISISHGEVGPNPRGERSQPVDPVPISSVEIAVKGTEIGPPIRPLGPAATPTATPQTTATVAAAPTVAMPPTEMAARIELDAKDIAFVPTEITIQAVDEPVTIHMINTGAAPHNFSIDSLKIDVDVAPGESADIIIPAGTAPGTYDFYCNVPGHKEAGMVGTLIVEGVSASTTSRSNAPGSSNTNAAAPSGGSAGCEGLTEYQDAIDMAYLLATLDNPDAARIILALDESQLDSDDAFNNLSPDEFRTLGVFFAGVADQMGLVQPPAYASEWHQVQIETYRLTAEFLEAASTQGAVLAAIVFDTRYQDLETATAAALAGASVCPDFVTWATEEGLS